MAAITAGAAPTPRPDRGRRARAAWAAAREALAATAVGIRRRDPSPALTAAGLGAVDIAAWTTYGRGAAWLALGASILIFDWSRDR